MQVVWLVLGKLLDFIIRKFTEPGLRGDIRLHLMRHTLSVLDPNDSDMLPKEPAIWAEFKIENRGREEGTLEYELEPKKWQADLFKIRDHGFEKWSLRLEGRQGPVRKWWRLSLDHNMTNLHRFAEELSGLGSKKYSLLFRYRTRRIGGHTRWHKIHISGTFGETKDQILEIWHTWQRADLISLAEYESRRRWRPRSNR